MLAVFLALFDLFGKDAVIFARTFVDLALIPGPLALGFEFIAAGTKFGDGLLREQLLKCPLLNVLLLILLELGDELNSALEN